MSFSSLHGKDYDDHFSYTELIQAENMFPFLSIAISFQRVKVSLGILIHS